MMAAVGVDRSARAVRVAIVQALEALEVGDLAYAVGLLLDALDEPSAGPPVCGICGQAAWPGDVSRHLWSRHHAAEDARAA